MKKISDGFSNVFRRKSGVWTLIALGTVAAISAGPMAAADGQPAPDKRTNQVLSANDLESLYGIRIMLIGVTAAGGLVDFRFKVLDQRKVEPLLKDPAHMPRLLAEDSGFLLPEPMHKDMMKHQKYKTNTVYFMLYPNTRDAVKAGRPVSLLIGDLRLEHLKTH